MTMASWANPEIDTQEYTLIGQAAGNYINTHGGINGVHVNVKVCNDFFTASGAETCAQEAVADKVVALVGGLSIFDGTVLSIIGAAHIPWIGGLPQQSLAFTSPYSFPIIAGPGLADTVLANRAADDCQRTALVDAGQGSAADIPFLDAGIKAGGKSYVATIALSASTPDYSAFAAQIKDANPDCLVEDINYVESNRLIPALQQAGISLNKIRVYVLDAYAPQVVDAYPKQVDGWIVASYFTSSYTSAAESSYKTATAYLLSKYPSLPTPDDFKTWAAYQVFETAASTISGPITSSSLLSTLNASSDLKTNGITPNIDFSKPNPQPNLARIFNPYVQLYTSKGGSYSNLAPLGAPVNSINVYKQGES
jgi:ABC-type branched-subunit amino acid transport system substrate-binding protein